MLKFIAKGGILIFLGGVVGKVLRFVFAIILARVLGAALCGVYSIGQSIVDIATNVGLLGDGRAVISMGAKFLHEKDPLRFKKVVTGYLFVSLIVAIVISLSVFFLSGRFLPCVFHSATLTVVLQLFALGFPAYILSLSVIPIGYALQRMEFKVIIQEVALPVLNIIAVSIIFILGGRLYGAAASFAVSSFLTALLSLYLIKKNIPGIIPVSIGFEEMRSLLKNSLPMMGIILCYYLLFRLDRIMLGIFRPSFEVGIYTAASNTAMCMLIFTGMFESSFMPVMAQLHHSKRPDELERVFHGVTFIGTAVAFVPCLALIIFNQEIMALFGSDFKIGGTPLIILSVAFLLEIVPGQLRQLFQMSSRQNIEFINSLAMTFSHIVLSIFLIPVLGMTGAAFSVLIAIALVSIVRTVELRVFFKFVPFSFNYIQVLIFMSVVLVVIAIVVIKYTVFFKALSLCALTIAFFCVLFKLQTEQVRSLWNDIKRDFCKFNFFAV